MAWTRKEVILGVLAFIGFVFNAILIYRDLGDRTQDRKKREAISMSETCKSYPCASSCDMSVSPCNGLIFEDTFSDFDLDKWEHEITMGGGGNWEFQYYTNSRDNSYVKDNTLFIKPTLTSDTLGSEDLLYSSRIDLWGAAPADLCTGNAWYGCERTGSPDAVVNPIQSARIRTVNSFNFKYGRLEVEAKLPEGDWLWPAIWLLPKRNAYGGWPGSGEIDLVEAVGNTNWYNHENESVGVDLMGSTMHWGYSWQYNGWAKTHGEKRLENGKTFASDFHVYAVDWTDSDITFFVDDEVILIADPGDDGFWKYGDFGLSDTKNPWRYTTDKMAPFNQEFYIIMNVAVGGVTGFFSDDNINYPYPKPWKNDEGVQATDFWEAKDDWYPTWNPDIEDGEGAALKVKSVRVWAFGSENDSNDDGDNSGSGAPMVCSTILSNWCVPFLAIISLLYVLNMQPIY